MKDIQLRSKALIQSPNVIVIGSSTGGLQALSKLFEDLKNCIIDIPILITQHIPEKFDESFAARIEQTSGRKIVIAKDKKLIESGVVYFAPSNKHLTVTSKGSSKYTTLDNSPPVNFCKPAVDPMFKSAAAAYGKNVMAIVLTGIGSDGLEGAKAIIAAGGVVIAQDKESSVVWGMPGAVAKAGICTEILPLDDIARFIKEYSFGKVRENFKMQILPHHAAFLKDYFFHKCGMLIGDDKAYLIDTRLTPVIKKHKLGGLSDLIQKIKDDDKKMISECLDAMLTNETHFFRDQKLYKIFKDDIIPQMVENCEGDTIKIWSAACSSGQEPYSIAITLLENIEKLQGKRFEIIASDLSTAILEKATSGIYNTFEIQRGLPEWLADKYFDKIAENQWKIKDEVKQYIRFTQQNLIEELHFQDMFDCIFCRYVLIYFDDKTKRSILAKLCEVAKIGAPVLLGTSETNNLTPEKLQQSTKLRSIFFRK